MIPGRLLGLDPGERRIGVALSDPAGIIAQPLGVIDRYSDGAAQALRHMIAEHDVESIVVGLPLSLDGGEGPAAAAAREFGEWVTEVTGLDVHYQDERFSTRVAEGALLEGGVRRKQRREIRDKVAAAVMLQAYLDSEARGKR